LVAAIVLGLKLYTTSSKGLHSSIQGSSSQSHQDLDYLHTLEGSKTDTSKVSMKKESKQQFF
jgi:hypothetical protein